MQKQKKSSQETIVQLWDRILVPPQGICITTSLSSSTGTKAPTQEEDGNFRLSTRFLKLHLFTSPLTKQKKATHPAALTPNFAIKTFPQKLLGSSGFLSVSCPFSLLGSAINLSRLQSPMFWFVWPHCASGTRTWIWQHWFSLQTHSMACVPCFGFSVTLNSYSCRLCTWLTLALMVAGMGLVCPQVSRLCSHSLSLHLPFLPFLPDGWPLWFQACHHRQKQQLSTAFSSCPPLHNGNG